MVLEEQAAREKDKMEPHSPWGLRYLARDTGLFLGYGGGVSACRRVGPAQTVIRTSVPDRRTYPKERRTQCLKAQRTVPDECIVRMGTERSFNRTFDSA